MHITLIPVRMDATLTVSRAGDVLTVNGEALDFGPLAEGGVLPAHATGNPWLTGDVARVAGQLRLTLILPHGADAPEATRFPSPITLTGNGPVTLPAYGG